VQVGLNKGEAKNALARAVFFNRLGELRDRTFENQRYRASGLNLVVAASFSGTPSTWSGHQRAARGWSIGQGFAPDPPFALGWEHINLTGDYVWHANKRVAKGGFRPLRKAKTRFTSVTAQPEA